jgi:hypothetical protein
MIRERPVQLILAGFVLVLIAWIVPFLMVLNIIPSTFLLDFLIYAAGVAGLFMGIIGAASYYSMKRKK